MTAPAWTIVICKSSQEEAAERSMRQAGYRVYLPRYRKEMRPHGNTRRGTPSMRPLFTGYLFVQDWNGWPEMSISGVSGLLKTASSNVLLQDADVMVIWEREKAGQFDELPAPRSKAARRTDLKIGGSVEFDLHGERILAVLEDLSDSGRTVVRGLMFNRETIYRVSADDLRAVSP